MPLTPDAGGWLVLGLAAAVGGLVGTAAWGIVRLFGHLAARTSGGLDDELAKRLPLPVSIALAAVAARIALAAGSDRLDAGLVSGLERALTVLFVAAAAWGLVRTLRAVFERTGRKRPRFEPATRLGGRLVAIVLYSFAFLTILSELGISVTPLLTGLGIAALAVALALQDTLSNFFSGIWIQTGRPLQPGHYVRLEQEKLEGYVEQVGWRTTRLRTLSGSTTVIPNAKFAQAIVTDFNLPSPEMSANLDFRVGYEADPNRVMAALVEEGRAVMRANPAHFVAGSEPFAQLSGLADDHLRFTLTLRVTEYVSQFKVQNDVRLRVLLRFRRDGIRIPYPTTHTIQEPVESPAQRLPHAPGGFGSLDRPASVAAPPRQGPDPRELEAQHAKADIEAQQAEAEAEKTKAGEPDLEGNDGKSATPSGAGP